MSTFRIFIIATLFVLAASCGDDSPTETGDLPVNTGDVGDVSTEPACLPDEPECDDTVVLPDDGQELPGDDADTGSSGMPVDGGLTIDVALTRSPADGIIAVQGIFYRDDTGAFLCSLLAESLPPLCGGDTLQLAGSFDTSIDAPIQASQGVEWTDASITLFGIVDDGVLTVDQTVNG
jgi:hypothetical protein